LGGGVRDPYNRERDERGIITGRMCVLPVQQYKIVYGRGG